MIEAKWAFSKGIRRISNMLPSGRTRVLLGWTLRFTGPLLLAVLLIWVVDVRQMAHALGEIRLSWALFALLATQMMILVRTLRWTRLHDAFSLGKATVGYQLRITYATSLASLVLPQVLSPFSRFLLLVQDGYPARRVAAASALEKLLELAAYLCFALFGSIYLGFVFGGLIWWAGGLSLAALGSLALLYAARSHVGRLARVLLVRLSNVDDEEADSVLREITALRAPMLAGLFAMSLLVALTQATVLFLLSRSLGLTLSYPLIVAAWGIIALSVLLPLSVSGIGTREAVLAAVFEASGSSIDAAVTLGLLVLAAVLVGSSPGAIEWIRRMFTSGREAALDPRTVAGSMAPTTVERAG